MLQPLATSGVSPLQLHINLSTSISLSLINETGKDMTINASIDNPIELIIPRDPALRMSPMTLQNVTSIKPVHHNQLYNLYFINIIQSNSNLTRSVHFEMHPLDANLGYIFVYRFDKAPQLTGSVYQTDGWSLWCPSSMYSLFVKIETLTAAVDVLPPPPTIVISIDLTNECVIRK